MAEVEEIPWYQSQTLRGALVAVVPAIVFGLKAAFKIDLTNLPLVDLLWALVGAVGTGIVVVHRVKQGKDPANPAPPIKMSPI